MTFKGPTCGLSSSHILRLVTATHNVVYGCQTGKEHIGKLRMRWSKLVSCGWCLAQAIQSSLGNIANGKN